ncbi:MAG: Fe(3+) ABC transporter substrate-binding protein [Proteobacteria bacterium]|nr:Fe(3+) ABC transporter substrate-binding protein [Pseudomonadota bacterium]
MTKFLGIGLASLIALGLPLRSHAQEKVLNLYSSRHYNTDEALYANFTKQTGIKINRIEAGEDPLIERIRNEGDKSPADVLITVDAGRLWRAEQMGFFQPVKSALLDARIPAALHQPNGLWFGFSVRARVIAYDKAKIKAGEITTYEDLADPKWKGKICVRSGSHIYNLSLGSSMIAAIGEAKTEAWAKGLVANFARTPKGGDTDQLNAVAAGECQIALVNTYYYARLARSAKPEERQVAEKLGIVTPNQGAGQRGTHINISGAGVMKNAPNRDNAVKFLDYLASDEAQRYFADGNNEWPAVITTQVSNPALNALGKFRYDEQNIAALGRNQPEAQKIYDRAGWK